MKLAYEKTKSVNQQLTLFLFKEEAIIYSDLSKSVHLLNAVGIYAWLLFEEGLSKQAVLAKCIEAKAESLKENEPELVLLVEELHTLFHRSSLVSIEESETTSQEELWLKEIIFDAKHNTEPNTAFLDATYKILDSYFYFSYPNKKIEKLLSPILEQFKLSETEQKQEREKHEANTHLKVIYIQIQEDADFELNKNYKLSINNYLFSWQIPYQRLLSFLLDRLRKLAFSYSSYFLAVHSAVLSKGETCLMLPAVSYSGKSTLSAALVSNGYQYLSDEMAVIDENFKARPVPLGLGLKNGSWEPLKSYLPELSKQQALERWDGVPIKYLPIAYEVGMSALKLSNETKQVSHLIFPHYQQGATANLKPLSTPQAIYQLYLAGYTQGKELSLNSLERILNWLSTMPVFSFEFDELEEATHCLSGLKMDGSK